MLTSGMLFAGCTTFSPQRSVNTSLIRSSHKATAAASNRKPAGDIKSYQAAFLEEASQPLQAACSISKILL